MSSNSNTSSFPSAQGQSPDGLLRRISSLEEKVRKLERALQVNANGNVTLRATGTLRLEGNAAVEMTSNSTVKMSTLHGNEIELSVSEIAISGISQVNVNVPMMQTSAGMLTWGAGTHRFTGPIQGDTIMATAFVDMTQGPGVGTR